MTDDMKEATADLARRAAAGDRAAQREMRLARLGKAADFLLGVDSETGEWLGKDQNGRTTKAWTE